ncbi:MAG: hypothetical protein QM626_13200 [Microbacterium sp.]|uniref:hypothetical protein n=1 Tax=Microbacterium sp. TaxID=51671 RepID=UPI0039E5F354
MNTTPRLTRSFPFWLLLVASLASLGYGAWLTIDKLTVMTNTLNDGTATGVEVYVGQSWAVFAAAFIGAGLFGLFLTLALVIVKSFVARPVEVVEAIDWTDEEYAVDDEPVAEDVVVETEVVADDADADADEKSAKR